MIKKIYNTLMSEYKNHNGVIALMCNIKAESNFKSNNLQNSYNKKLGYTDESYTSAVDNYKYHNFVKDAAGYGLCQWTYWTRKEALLNYCRRMKVSVGDLDAQLDFMINEIRGYKKVDAAIRTGVSIREISDIIMTQYERPANQSESYKAYRASLATEIEEELGNVSKENTYSSSEIVKLAQSWLGKNEKDGSYKEIIDIYNTQTKLPRGYKVQYDDAWCATFVSALAVKLGYTDIIPCECSCQKMIEIAKVKGIWVEDDSYECKAGDIVMYDWDDNGKGDCTGWADHVGIVEVATDKTFKVIEGNYSNSVKRRNMKIDGIKIRGYIVPKYSSTDLTEIAKEVIAGKWGNGEERKKRLKDAGYSYTDVQRLVNKLAKG